MKDSKNLVIGMLCAVVCIMAVAYAAFSTTLNINGTASIESSWAVGIQSTPAPSCTFQAANETTASTKACETGSTMCASVTRESASLATVTMKFQQPGDTATCTIVYENTGSLDATLTHDITGTTDTNAIKWTFEGVTGTQTLTKADGATPTHTVKVTGTFVDVDEDQDGNSDVLEEADKTATLEVISTAKQAGV